MEKKYLEIGKIVAVHGLRGDIRIQPWCNTPEFLTKFRKLYLHKGEDCLKVEKSGVHKNVVLTHFAGIDTREAAAELVNCVVYIDRKDVRLPKGEYFVQDLLGLDVVDADTDRVYGKLTDIFETGANGVYTVTSPDGTETLIPVIDDVIVKTDLKAGKLLIRPLKGLFDDEN